MINKAIKNEILHRQKYRRKRIMNAWGRRGRFWAVDYYDKLIRDEKHFSVVYDYIKNNPLVLNKVKGSVPRFYGVYD